MLSARFCSTAQENNMNTLVEGANIQHELGWAVSKLKILEKLAQNSRRLEKNGGRPLVDGVVVVDVVVLRYSMAINYYTALNLTKLDVLDTFETIKIAVAYKGPESGEELASYPTDPDILDRAHVVYHEMLGWKRPTTNVKTFDDLPKQATLRRREEGRSC
ncbi:adenylosuccinate synthetase [Cordyceps fumosorosea ARSEF 2679]|uniref:Adenylosuccinate synthetase n=1 Tax=Cordyceps fumosorosea (strain ARSEF 2679) TaxID=1081104 RepID=A0A167WIQ3_CORFA|nr:adenylosuccinate synthetase [Cordyceps fumosorosea ARSEF 2679]OAA63839.1 adenylosuccinate synthetase [Cordyceps fumosorosea ARSEF 2679]